MMDFRKSGELIDEVGKLLTTQPPALIAARLSLAKGRTHFRFNRLEEAAAVLDKAASQAEVLGDDGYETRVVAQIMRAGVAGYRNRIEQAQTIYSQAIELCQERGDRVHLAVVHGNRYHLWLMRGDAQRAVEDSLICRQIGRETGFSEIEYVSSYNLAEIYYYNADREGGAPYLRRAVEMEPSNSKRPLSWLLELRILVFDDSLEEASVLLERLSKNQREMRASGDLDGLFTNAEELLYEMIQLALGDGE